MDRFKIALIAYVGIAVFAWFTLEDWRLRAFTVLLMAMFAVRTLTAHLQQRVDQKDGSFR